MKQAGLISFKELPKALKEAKSMLNTGSSVFDAVRKSESLVAWYYMKPEEFRQRLVEEENCLDFSLYEEFWALCENAGIKVSDDEKHKLVFDFIEN